MFHPAFAAVLEIGINDAFRYGYEAAGYHCAENGCRADGADERVAFFTLLLVVATLTLAGITFALFVATYRLYRTTLDAIGHTKEDAEETRKQARELFTAERRAWVAVKREIVSPLQRMGERGSISIRVSLENVGLSPAIDVRLEWPSVPMRMPYTFVERERMRDRLEFLRQRNHSDQLGVAIFPGNTFEEICIAIGEIVADGGNPVAPTIAGWVSYRFAQGGKLHFTPFTWELHWRTLPDGNPDPVHTFLSESRLGLPPD